MNNTTLFTLASNITIIGWLLLIFGQKWKFTRVLVQYALVSILLSLIYVWLIFNNQGTFSFSDFGTLDGVTSLFSNEYIALAGWVHYLAFDLWIGSWVVGDAKRRGINHWYLLPCLVFTFMLGPIGLLMYLLLRSIILNKLFLENFN